MKVLLASKSKIKLDALKEAFENYFENVEVFGVETDSNVRDNPINDEVLQGAKNRLQNLIENVKNKNLSADYFASAESGIVNFFGEWQNLTIVIIRNNEGKEAYAVSAAYPVPEKYIEEIKNSDLTKLYERLFPKNSKHAGSGISALTNRATNRKKLIRQAFILALAKFTNGEIWC